MSPSNVSQLARGSVVLIRFPFTDLTSDKRRPAILVTDTSAVSGADGHFVFMGSEVPPTGEPHILIAKGTAAATAMGLLYPAGKTNAYIRPRKIATLAVTLVTRRIGAVPPAIMGQIDALLTDTLGL